MSVLLDASCGLGVSPTTWEPPPGRIFFYNLSLSSTEIEVIYHQSCSFLPIVFWSPVVPRPGLRRFGFAGGLGPSTVLPQLEAMNRDCEAGHFSSRICKVFRRLP